LISGGDDAINTGFDTLDNAAIFASGVFASRPAANALSGKLYVATDTGAVYLSDGTNWIELASGAPVPIGGSLDYAGSGDPADTRYLLEDGRAISRATYATLFGLIGTTYGSGNGTTTFNIPDSRGRTSVAPDDMGTAAGAASRLSANKTLGASGGAETKTLATGELPSHTHAVGTLAMDSQGSHDHGVGTLTIANESAHVHAISLTSGGQSADHSHSGTTGGRSAAHTHGMSQSRGSYTFGTSGITATIVEIIGASGSYNTGVSMNTESADHTHAFTTGGASVGHTHSVSGNTGSTSHTHSISGSVASNGAHTHTISGSTASAGSGTAFNMMQPYVVKNKIIRVL